MMMMIIIMMMITMIIAQVGLDFYIARIRKHIECSAACFYLARTPPVLSRVFSYGFCYHFNKNDVSYNCNQNDFFSGMACISLETRSN